MLKLAIAQAEKVEIAHNNRFRIGAVVFNGWEVLNVGHCNANVQHSNAFYYRHGKLYQPLHAEFDALWNCRNTNGSDIIVVRIDSFGNLKMAKPCKFCHGLIKRLGIRKIYYTNDDGILCKINPLEED
jgi:tRNA(Arg) A34 adenosine deaminase TadA